MHAQVYAAESVHLLVAHLVGLPEAAGDDDLAGARVIVGVDAFGCVDLRGCGHGELLVASSQFSVLSSQFSVLSSQFSVLSSQFSVLSSQFSVLSSQFSVLSSQFSVLSSQFSVLSSQLS